MMLRELASELISILVESEEGECHLMRKLCYNRWGWGEALSIDLVRHVVTSHQFNRTTSLPQNLR